MKVNELGLVPCVVEQSFDNFFIGDIAGFVPDKARALKRKGAVRYHDDYGEAEQPVEVKKTDAKPSGTGDGDGDEKPKGALDIEALPENWREAHQFSLLALAKKISGDKPAGKDAAIAVIEAELKRRASGEQSK